MTPVTQLGAGSAVWSRRRLLAVLSLAALVRPANAAGALVEIRGFRFAPEEIEIAAGGTVTFVNRDLAPHTATGESFDTGTLERGEHGEIRFESAGEYRYLCRFHRHMVGIVRVK